MIRCKVCNKLFIAKSKNKYLITKAPTLAEALICQSSKIFECFDCPKCGCQNIVNVREENKVESISTSKGSTCSN